MTEAPEIVRVIVARQYGLKAIEAVGIILASAVVIVGLLVFLPY